METKELSQIFPKEVIGLCSNPDTLLDIGPNDTLRMGFGVDNTVTIRTLAYPLLGLELLRALPSVNLQLYTSTEFCYLNNINPGHSQQLKATQQGLISSFLYTFAPDIAPRVSFIEPRPISPAIDRLLDEMAQILGRDDEINCFAQKFNGFDSLRYMAAHALYMGDQLNIPDELTLLPQGNKDSRVQMIGGPAEGPFLKARQILSAKIGSFQPPSQIFTLIGRKPPYFRADMEPIVASDTQRIICPEFLLSTTPEVCRDYLAILAFINQDQSFRYQDIFGRGKLGGQDSLKRQSTINSAQVQAGVSTLNQFLNS